MRAAKVDTSQKGIVEALEAAGCAVCSTARLGDGFPDLLAAIGPLEARAIYFFECKTPKASRHKKPEENQRSWAERMGITVHVVSTPEQAIAVLSPGVDIDAVHKR